VVVVDGMVEVGAVGGGAASRVDTRPVPDFDVAAEYRPGEPGGRILRGQSSPAVAEVLGALGVQVGHYASPLTAAVRVRGELGEQSGG
jgi:hypothetical protein